MNDVTKRGLLSQDIVPIVKWNSWSRRTVDPGDDGLKRLQLTRNLFDCFVDDSCAVFDGGGGLIDRLRDDQAYLIAVCRGKRSYLLTMLTRIVAC